MTVSEEIEKINWVDFINKLKSIFRKIILRIQALESPTEALYQSYIAKVVQTGTSAPTPTVLENTLKYPTQTWNRGSGGSFSLDKIGIGDTREKTVILITSNRPDVLGVNRVFANNTGGDTYLVFENYDLTETLTDGFDISIEIRVYN